VVDAIKAKGTIAGDNIGVIFAEGPYARGLRVAKHQQQSEKEGLRQQREFEREQHSRVEHERRHQIEREIQAEKEWKVEEERRAKKARESEQAKQLPLIAESTAEELRVVSLVGVAPDIYAHYKGMAARHGKRWAHLMRNFPKAFIKPPMRTNPNLKTGARQDSYVSSVARQDSSSIRENGIATAV
jgi:hypothetical protein